MQIRELCRKVSEHTLASCELLTGGASNLNYLLRFDGSKDSMVLRIFTHDPQACAKELAILRSAHGILPVPDVVHASPKGEEGAAPFMVYRFVEGVTFQELKSRGDTRDMAEAAYA